jgi:thiosulfate reductase cytochrome b subunit
VTVRITHWLHTLAFLGLLVSGVAILLAHPRLYWGEAGGVGMPSLLDLPLPFVIKGQTGWGRSLHFQSAWLCVLNGLVYLGTGPLRRTHNSLQKATYRFVVFLLFPLAIWTGFAMSPALTSVFPALVTVWGGQQSARTIHFFAACVALLFLLGHVIMAWRAGLRSP